MKVNCPFCASQGENVDLILYKKSIDWQYLMMFCPYDNKHILVVANVLDDNYLDELKKRITIMTGEQGLYSPLVDALTSASCFAHTLQETLL